MGNWDKRKKGTFRGIALIAFGLISGAISYFNDSSSMDYFSMTNAGTLAVVHAVLWSVVGLAVIAWYNMPSGDDDGSGIPSRFRDDQRDGSG